MEAYIMVINGAATSDVFPFLFDFNPHPVSAGATFLHVSDISPLQPPPAMFPLPVFDISPFPSVSPSWFPIYR